MSDERIEQLSSQLSDLSGTDNLSSAYAEPVARALVERDESIEILNRRMANAAVDHEQATSMHEKLSDQVSTLHAVVAELTRKVDAMQATIDNLRARQAVANGKLDVGDVAHLVDAIAKAIK